MFISVPIFDGKIKEVDKVTRALAVSTTVIFKVQLAIETVATEGEMSFTGIVAVAQISDCAVGEDDKLIADTPTTLRVD